MLLFAFNFHLLRRALKPSPEVQELDSARLILSRSQPPFPEAIGGIRQWNP